MAAPRRRRRRKAAIVIPIIGAILGFAGALAILSALNIGGGGEEYPPGYFGDILRLSAEADAELAEIMPVEVGAACRDGEGDGLPGAAGASAAGGAALAGAAR